MDFYPYFEKGLPYEDFLAKFGNSTQQQSWADYRSRVQLSDTQKSTLETFTRQINVLCMAGTWCGDCVQQCPIFDVIEKTASSVSIRYVDRDEDETLKQNFTICGGARVPQVVFLSEDGQFVARSGDRTLSRYRSMAANAIGAACPTGIVGESGDPILDGVVQDWLNEFERVHLILRLSPRLRQIHGD